MISTENARLDQLIIHKIGNKSQDEGYILAKTPTSIQEELLHDLLIKYFLSPVRTEVFYQLFHDADISLNEVYTYCSQIFNDSSTFNEQSVNLAKCLYEHSDHPQIKTGEFYVVLFSGVNIDNTETQAIGLFKSENKDTYLKIQTRNDNFEINHDEGININKLDKGCLIFNIEKENGYKVIIADNTNRSEEAQYWKNGFLKVKRKEDNFFHTQNFLKMCGSFSKEVLTEENNVDKTEQLIFKNRSMEFFKKRESFTIEDFQTEVIQEPAVIEAFKGYKDRFSSDYQLPVTDSFDIAPKAVKSSNKFMKSILKLDKNFHVYIHGNGEYLEKGYDDIKGMNYYTLYFNKES